MTDFENAMKKVTDMLHAAARKSGEIFENTKISYNISVERDKIVKLQSKIGEKFYKIYKEGGAVPEIILSELEEIAAVEELIREMEKTIADSKPYKFCSDCGAKLELNDVYCAKCGAKQHDAEKNDKADDECCCADDCCKEDECADEACADDCCKDEAGCCDGDRE